MMRVVSFLVGSGSLIGMMLLIRVTLRGRIPPGILYALWLVPAVRLLLPFSLVPVPVLPEAVREANVPVEGVGDATAHAAVADNAQDIESVEVDGMSEEAFRTGNREDMQIEAKAEKMSNRQEAGILNSLLYIWLSGSILCGGYVILINRRLKRRIEQMERLPEKRLVPVYIREEAVSPCLFGFFHPCILLSRQTTKNREVCRQALLHEETHYRQKDHIWTAFRIFLCVIYWWNPLVWLGAVCAREDAEFACDARALRGAALSEKKAYGYALLEIMQGVQDSGTIVQGITSVSGKGRNMKRRLENIVSEHKRTSLWPLPVGLLLLLFLCAFCFPAQRANAEGETSREPNADEEMGRESNVEGETSREPDAEEEMLQQANMEVAEKIENAAVEESESVQEENGADAVNRIKDSGMENVREDRTGETETGIRLQPQEHREGYKEPELHYTASADWLTDLTGRQEEQEKIENLARRALRELYDLTGYQVEACFYGYNEIGILFFARREEDMAHSRVFYSYSMGEKDGYGIIPSIDIVSARRVWYSDVQQLVLPVNAESMKKEELAVWFLEHSPLCPEGTVVKIEPASERRPGCLKLTMEDGTFYETDLDVEILAVNNIYGPYPKNARH